MSKEQGVCAIPLKPNGLNHTSSEKPLSAIEKIAKPVIARLAEAFISRGKNKLWDPIKPAFADGFEKVYSELMQNENIVPIIISSHEGHADVLTLAEVSKELTKLTNETRPASQPFKGFLLPVAASIDSGHQNLITQQLTGQLKKRLPEYSLLLESYVRKKDAEQYSLERDNQEFTHKLRDAIKEGSGLAFFPEGSVESGKRIREGENKGQRKWMQKFDRVGFDQLIRLIKLCRKEPLFIVIGSYGAFDIFDPDHRVPTKKAILRLLTPKSKSLILAKVGMPIAWERMIREIGKPEKEIGSDDIGDYLGREVAKLLPVHARGVYA